MDVRPASALCRPRPRLRLCKFPHAPTCSDFRSCWSTDRPAHASGLARIGRAHDHAWAVERAAIQPGALAGNRRCGGVGAMAMSRCWRWFMWRKCETATACSVTSKHSWTLQIDRAIPAKTRTPGAHNAIEGRNAGSVSPFDCLHPIAGWADQNFPRKVTPNVRGSARNCEKIWRPPGYCGSTNGAEVVPAWNGELKATWAYCLLNTFCAHSSIAK